MVDNQTFSEEDDLRCRFDKNDENDANHIYANEDEEELDVTPEHQQSHDDEFDAVAYENDQLQNMSDNNNMPPPSDKNDGQMSKDDDPMEQSRATTIKIEPTYAANKSPSKVVEGGGVGEINALWTLPEEKDHCTLEEIRRGQVINKKAPNECPVIGCVKKINELRVEPPPGTISSGLRTHVLYVHYNQRKMNKKRKLGWSTKRRSQVSPRKQIGQISAFSSSQNYSSSASEQDYDIDSQNNSVSNCLNLTQKNSTPNPVGLTLHKKIKQLTAKSQALQQHSSLQSLMQATGGARLSPQQQQQQPNQSQQQQPNPPQQQQKNQDLMSQKNFNQTTSSLFSILAGLTQQQQQPQVSTSRNIKTAHGTNTINISQCSKNSINNNNRPANSSLLSLLNEKISGNVASSLQTQLKKSLGTKIPSSLPRQNVLSPANSSYYQSGTNNDPSFNGSATVSLLNSLYSANGVSNASDVRLNSDNSISLHSFIESIASRTGSNIGSTGVAEAKKIIEKFTSSLICSAQTIADHYIAPFAGDVTQQKPEISPSDLMLAYKMMHKAP